MKTKTILIYTAILATGLLLGYLFFGTADSSQSMSQHIEEAHTDEQGNIVYTCSMHPSVRQEEPGNCPICGMDLIPAENGGGQAENEYTLTMTEASLRLAEIQTSPVIMDRPITTFALPGKVVENQNRVSNVTAHFPGRIRDLYVDYTGTYVRQGDKLASIYSPELIAAQQELLETLKHRDQNPRLYESARRKLALWEFPESTINRIEESGEIMTELDFFSPVSGYVTHLNISREDHVMEGDPMYRIVDLSKVWIDFEAFESNISRIHEGDRVRFTVEALSGERFESTVIYVDPFLSDDTRTSVIRAEVDNPAGSLKPGMLARAEIESALSQDEVMLVPRSAVMWTGKRSIVYVRLPDADSPAFEAREVVLGPRAGDFFVVESGLSEGEQVVTNGTFKVDSAAQLADKRSMMNREPGTGRNGGAHQHHEMPEGSMQGSESGPDPQNGHSHGEHLRILINSYMEMTHALVQSDFDSAKAALQTFHQEVTTSSEMEDHPEHSEMHEEHHAAMVAAVESAMEAETIGQLRESYQQISQELIKAMENQGYGETLFVQFCPMADGGDGAAWLSRESEINNPYYGDVMLRCGNTLRTIE